MAGKRLKFDCILLILFVVTAIWNVVSIPVFHIRHIPSFLYILISIIWTVSILQDIPDRFIRNRFIVGGVLFVMLFVVRFIKWTYVTDGTLVERFCRYLYYVPILTVPLLTMSISLYIGYKNKVSVNRIRFLLWAGYAILMILLFTNEFHGLVLKIWYADGIWKSSGGYVFYLITVWYIGLSIASFVILLHKSRISAPENHSAVPITIAVISMVLWVVYIVNGSSSPTFMGIGLYNIQEVYLLGSLGVWESFILIGLIPSKSLATGRKWIAEGILATVNSESEEIKLIYEKSINADEEEFKDRIMRIGCLGSYIKRRANLELMADADGTLSTMELALAIRETFDYYSLAGISTGYEETGNGDVSALLITSAYEIVKNVLETKGISACYVKVRVSRTEENTGFKMVIESDPSNENESDNTPGTKLLNSIDKEMLKNLGAALNIKEQDDTLIVELSAEYPMNGSASLNKLHPTGDDKTVSYGLRGLVSFLSLEAEALRIKTRIHDSLGRSLLMIKRYLSEPGSVDRDILISEIGRTIAEIERYDIPVPAAANSGRNDPAPEHKALSPVGEGSKHDKEFFVQRAKNLGIELVIKGDIPDNERLFRVIETAITVHVTNVLKHTEGRKAYIEIDKRDDTLILRFTNEGKVPVRIEETGGLKNLRSRVENMGGTMKIDISEGFLMEIVLPNI